VEGFDPEIKDVLDQSQSPLKGKRIFHFPFVVSQAGRYRIPGLRLYFFNPDTNTYKTVSTNPIEININGSGKKIRLTETGTTARRRSQTNVWWIAGGALLAMFVISTFLIKSRRKSANPERPLKNEKVPAMTVEEVMAAAYQSLRSGDKDFYQVLQKCSWNYLGMRFGLSGSKMNKLDVQNAMRENQFSEEQISRLLQLLQQCETSVFTGTHLDRDNRELLQAVKAELEGIHIHPAKNSKD
jgi:hypothetical protein